MHQLKYRLSAFVLGAPDVGRVSRENHQSEHQYIMAVLARTQFDKRKAARILGISLASLYRNLGERRISDPPLQN